MNSFKVDYKNTQSELCIIGSKYDTDKSSQRKNVTDQRHCHPYTLFYNSLFKNNRDDQLKIAELGILEGSSLLMWREYFKNSNIYGFEYSDQFINSFKSRYSQERIKINKINVNCEENIVKSFTEVGEMYDIIIEDTTHQFDDQIRVIRNAWKFLKPGGVLIVEDIFLKYNESDYIDNVKEILKTEFQNYFFITLEHQNKNSTGWNNDKLFVLIKNGTPIFKTPKAILITPSCRLENIDVIYKSLNFNYIEKWIIVYDGSKVNEIPQNNFNDKVVEYINNDPGKSGNPQRNYALTLVEPGKTVYFLDDDNLIHPDFYCLLNSGIIDSDKLYSFNQTGRLIGDNLKIGNVDTAMVLFNSSLFGFKNIQWETNKYEADGIYISEIYSKNNYSWVFINNDLCYYNKIHT
jgi:predicted O-methyltransferase YrrM